MALEPTIEDQQHLADTRRRARAGLSRPELLAELVVDAGLFAAVAALWWLRPPHGVDPVAAACSVAALLLAVRVRFETPFGFTVATQLAFVPLVFALPLALVPLVFMAAMAAGALPEVLRGQVGPRALLRAPGNSWSSVFPCLVLALSGVAPDRAGAWLLLAALAAQFAGDFAVSGLFLIVMRGAEVRALLRDTWVYAIDAALSAVGLAVAEEMHAAPYAVLAVVPLLGLLWMFARERHGRLDNLLALNDTYRGTALLLGDVISADDGYTGEHCQDVVNLALAVGERLGLDAERLRNLEFAAMLHDIGKIAVPKEILNKPGALDPAEWEIMKTHAAEGERMLSRVGGFMREVGRIVRSHHERWDGGGYPDGLRGAAAPLEARIITACDSWNAMRTDRPYRSALSTEAAMAELLANAGSQFDPALVTALVAVVASADRDAEPAEATPPLQRRPAGSDASAIAAAA